MRPSAWKYAPKPTLWVDFKTGRGVTGDGVSVRPVIGDRRKNPNLTDLLDTAHSVGAARIMLTGKVPEPVPGKSHWLIARTPGWTPGSHWLTTPVTGRFTHEATGTPVEVRTVAEWFGTNDIRPQVARVAWDVTAHALADAVPGAVMALTPAMTGANAWALSLPRQKGRRRQGDGTLTKGDPFDLEPIPEDVAAELHRTSGQHRMEHLVAGPDRCDCGACLPTIDPAAVEKLGAFAYVDGRFMYASVVRGLGTNGFRRLNRAASAEVLERDPYVRGRFYVRATVPDGWDHVGLLGVQHSDVSKGWHYPNRPGARLETWADAAEIMIARDRGWLVEPVEGLVLGKSKVLDVWGDRLTRARETVEASRELDPAVRKAAAAALRAMLIGTVGNFASRSRERSVTVWDPADIPAEHAHSTRRFGEAFVYDMPGRPMDERMKAFYRPELAAQVWARARARVLVSPTATGAAPGGALAMRPGELLGINGDAVYCSEIPAWSLPTSLGWAGAGDDGKVGRLRIKGVLEHVATPATLAERLALREQADGAGLDLLGIGLDGDDL